jgi:dihydropteroate synthase
MNPPLTIGRTTFAWGTRTYVMGILNVTPDSFSGDGLISSTPSNTDVEEGIRDRRSIEPWQIDRRLGEKEIETALEMARRFVKEGADILDVGGESTRPGAQTVSLDEELERVLPVIRSLASQSSVPISIDTYKAEVAEAALQVGAQLVNDVWGFKVDPRLAEVAARHQVPVILMHNRSSWANAEIQAKLGGRYVGVPYDNLLEDIRRELMESVDIARQAGIPDEYIILDPGIGFGKTVEQNLELLDRLAEIRQLGYPVLLGASRKSFIGYTLNLSPDQRVEGTAAAVAIGIARGADIVRVHDVGYIARVARMTDAIVRRTGMSKV